MPKYWVKRATGDVIGEITTHKPVPHSDWLMIDAPSLPGPIETVYWDGNNMVVNLSRLNNRKMAIAREVWTRMDKPFSFTFGPKTFTFILSQARALLAMEARARRAVAEADATWTLSVRADDGTYVTATGAQVVEVCERIGDRLHNRWNAIMSKLQILESMTAAELAAFDPEVS